LGIATILNLKEENNTLKVPMFSSQELKKKIKEKKNRKIRTIASC